MLMPAASQISLTRGFSMHPCSHITDSDARGFVREIGDDGEPRVTYYADMTEKRPHYLREWREFRKMTLRDLAKAVGTSPSTVSDLETFKLQLSPKWLRRFAPILDCQEGHLIDHDPNELDSDIIEIWTRISKKDRPTALRMLEGLAKTGTDN